LHSQSNNYGQATEDTNGHINKPNGYARKYGKMIIATIGPKQLLQKTIIGNKT
jgi:hypothetical protein